MYNELNLSDEDGVLAAYNAVCELVEDTERLQAECAAKEAELAELRGQTAELFGARLEAEGMGEEAVTAAKAMWQSDPQSVAMATLGCDFAEAANPYGCNQYGHGFKEPHGAAGGRGQKTFDFFDETQKEVNKDRRKAQRAYDSATKDTEKALDRVKETADAVERFANSPDDKTKSMDELISEADKLKEANKQAIKDAKAARRRQLEAAREAGKKVKPAFNGNKNGNIDDALYDEFKDVFDDDDVKSSRTLEELLEEEEIVKSSHYDGYEIDEEVDAANPYGCNQYGHEWKGKHGANFGGKSGGKQDSKKEPEKKEGEKGGYDAHENQTRTKKLYEKMRKLAETFKKDTRPKYEKRKMAEEFRDLYEEARMNVSRHKIEMHEGAGYDYDDYYNIEKELEKGEKEMESLYNELEIDKFFNYTPARSLRNINFF
jgi:hypothetical protein